MMSNLNCLLFPRVVFMLCKHHFELVNISDIKKIYVLIIFNLRSSYNFRAKREEGKVNKFSQIFLFSSLSSFKSRNVAEMLQILNFSPIFISPLCFRSSCSVKILLSPLFGDVGTMGQGAGADKLNLSI
jgi:hypothetical protein